MISALEENPRLKTAAIVAEKFKMDPVAVLKSSYYNWAIRVAALQYVLELEKESAARAKGSKGRPQGNFPDVS